MGPTFATRQNLELLEEMYGRWKADSMSIDQTWRAFFEGFELGGSAIAGTGSSAQTNIVRLIYAYRDFGHYQANLDPLSPPPPEFVLLNLDRFGFTVADLDKTFDTSPFVGTPRATLRELIAALRETYCHNIAVEMTHVTTPKARAWIKSRMEATLSRPNYSHDRKLEILKGLHQASNFEKFLQTTFVGQKRFSLEGGDALIPMMQTLIESGSHLGVHEMVIGMAHRGRLNVLANVLHKPYQEIINEFEDNYLADSSNGDGDVKYHLGFSSDYPTHDGESVHLSLSPNPSHLEAVDPVVVGRVRAKQYRFHDEDHARGVPVLIHGDAAVMGQGVVAETLNMARLEGYNVGGTVHIVINNQIGFTTKPADARSTRYCTDIFKMAQVPIFHVNGEDPEACAFAAELAMAYRQEFKNDVAIDLVCYRKHGHNEGDEPSFTSPTMYKKIRNRPTPGQIYAQRLIDQNELTAEEAKQIEDEDISVLQAARAEAKLKPKKRGMVAFTNYWGMLQPAYNHNPVETGVPRETLDKIAKHLAVLPDGFTIHPKLLPQIEARVKSVVEDGAIDWGTAEALAFGSLVLEGTPVRLTGQDSRRGTFSHRHDVYTDFETDQRYCPLGTLRTDQKLFEIFDSSLSEAAVLGFEYGYSTDSPEALVAWEAQFGDFVNGAQVIIDQFIVSGESKWQRSNGVVLLLPHGHEGQGPEHSSARLERFLQLCAEDNIQVCNFTTPAQYFHALRRQTKRDFRKPLIVMTPKSLLRSKAAVSKVEDFVSGRFREVLDDDAADPAKIDRVVMCSGKVYYDLLDKRSAQNASNVALVRLEQFYPWPDVMMAEVLGRYKNAKNWVWCQEESQNNGGWSFVEPRLRNTVGNFVYVGRDASASPAVGSLKIHQREQNELVEAALSQPKAYIVAASPNPVPAPETQKA